MNATAVAELLTQLEKEWQEVRQAYTECKISREAFLVYMQSGKLPAKLRDRLRP
jgi:hypothetical protein